MDKRDLQILRILAENCRIQNSTIAKALNLSKDTIKNRIQTLEKTNIITHYNTITDLRPLGFSKFQLLIKLKSDTNKENLLKKIKNHDAISFINTFIGKYDLHIIVDTRDIYTFNKIKSDIFDLLENKIQDYTVLEFHSDTKHTNLIPETSLEIRFEKKLDTSFSSLFSKSHEIEESFSVYKVDKKDLEILKVITNNPRISLVDMSEKLKLNREAIKQRMIKLIEKSIIKNFGANPFFEAFNYVTYFLLAKTNEELSQHSIKSQFAEINNIFYSAKTHGDYSLITYILAKNPRELKETINKIQNILGTKTINLDVMIFDSIHLYKQFPTSVLKELEAKN